MHVLETVRVYPQGRDCHLDFVQAKVNESHQLVGEGDNAITVAYMKEGAWIGERTLQLPNGAAIVFNGPTVAGRSLEPEDIWLRSPFEKRGPHDG